MTAMSTGAVLLLAQHKFVLSCSDEPVGLHFCGHGQRCCTGERCRCSPVERVSPAESVSEAADFPLVPVRIVFSRCGKSAELSYELSSVNEVILESFVDGH